MKMISRNPIRRTALVALMVSAATARAHDFWLEPSTFRPAVGQTVTVSLRVGQEFVGDPIPRSQQLMDTFTMWEGGGERPVGGFENQDPAGYLRVDQSGFTILGYRSKPYPLELAADKFNEFLQKEGLEQIAALRASRGESDKPDRERFYRYAKALLLSGSAAGNAYKRPFGFRYEIIPESNPLDATPLHLRILFEGKPARGVLVSAIHRDDPSARVSARTDGNGRATLALPENGVWLVKSVQIVPAPPDAKADWESLWASLTFER